MSTSVGRVPSNSAAQAATTWCMENGLALPFQGVRLIKVSSSGKSDPPVSQQ